MIIPLESLSEEAINNLVSEYCLQDWGLNEQDDPLSSRQTVVRQALEQGRLKVLYSELHETASLVAAEQLIDSEQDG